MQMTLKPCRLGSIWTGFDVSLPGDLNLFEAIYPNVKSSELSGVCAFNAKLLHSNIKLQTQSVFSVVLSSNVRFFSLDNVCM